MEPNLVFSGRIPNALCAPEHRSVLVVDPHDDTRQLYRKCFELAGYAVTEASEGRDALVKALVGLPSLVVTELRLPWIGGVSLCELLRRDAATAGMPILIVTGESRQTELERAAAAGADAVLTKPAALDNLIESANGLLTRSRELQVRSAAIGPTVDRNVDRSPALFARSDTRRRTRLSKSHARFETTNPPAPPPALNCRSCNTTLTYDHSHIGGVSTLHSEQWDYYMCACGRTFQYRHRTRKLRRVG